MNPLSLSQNHTLTPLSRLGKMINTWHINRTAVLPTRMTLSHASQDLMWFLNALDAGVTLLHEKPNFHLKQACSPDNYREKLGKCDPSVLQRFKKTKEKDPLMHGDF